MKDRKNVYETLGKIHKELQQCYLGLGEHILGSWEDDILQKSCANEYKGKITAYKNVLNLFSEEGFYPKL